MEKFVWQSYTPLELEESEYVFTCGCNIKHPWNKTKRDRCTKACYEKKLRKNIVKDCEGQCKGWFTGSDKRACKKICRETGGMEDLTREDVLDEIAGVYPDDWADNGNGEFNGEPGLAGIGNMNTIIAVVIGVIVLIGAIIMFKK